MFSRSKRTRSQSVSRSNARQARGRFHQALFEGLETRTLMAANPIGNADLFSPTGIAGWAFDADAGANPIKVRITIDGTQTEITADQARPDLVGAVGSANHGFSFNPNLTPGAHTVTVAAIDPETNVPVTLRSGTITNPAPIGNADLITSTRIAGWAFDQDAGANPIQVRIDVNGQTVQTVSANINRPDLAVLGSTAHGFDVTGNFNGVVDIYGIDVNSGKATLLKTTNRPSRGNVEVFTRNQVAGWVFDPDRPDAAVTVRVKVDGNVVAEAPANMSRPDLAGVTGGSTNHGFIINISVPPGTHKIDVVAVESDTSSLTETVIGTTAAAVNPPPIGSIDVANSTQVIGWVFDADAGATPLQAEIRVDGVSAATVTANLARPDLVVATGSPNHGFSATLSGLSQGPHLIELYTTDNPSGTTVKIASKVINNTLPFGSVDIANPQTIAGWAYDPDSPSTPVQVIYEIDGTRYSAVTANQTRNDLTNLPNKAHGYNDRMPTHLFGNHTVRVIAIDTFDGTESVLATRVFTNNPPTGNVDFVSANGNIVAGWAYDPDSPATQIGVLLRLDGSSIIAQIPANQPRGDLTGVFANHAYGVVLDLTRVTSRGAHVLEVFAIDPSTGVTALLGARNIVV
jgi:hypothetical protein